MSEISEVKREWIEVSRLFALPENPNVMSDIKFSELVEKIRDKGFDQEVKVFFNQEKNIYEVIKGNHRVEASKYLQYEKVPCVIGDYKDRDEAVLDAMSDNIIRGEIDPEIFTELYTKYKGKYGTDELLKKLNVSGETELKKFIKEIRQNLPQEMKSEFDKASKDAKTIEDLSFILNKLFNEYGDTLEYNFMYFMYSGEIQLLVKMSKDMKDLVEKFTNKAKTDGVDINVYLEQAISEWLGENGSK